MSWRGQLGRGPFHPFIQGPSTRRVSQAHVNGCKGLGLGEFHELFDAKFSTPVLVVSFIALLELSRESLVELTQAEAFAPIYVRLAYSPN